MEGSGANVSEGQSSSVPEEKKVREGLSNSEASRPKAELSLICADIFEDKNAAELVVMLVLDDKNALDDTLLPVRLAIELGVLDKNELHSVSIEAREGGVKSSSPDVRDMPLRVGEAMRELTVWNGCPCIRALD